jgi:hypothetical protein
MRLELANLKTTESAEVEIGVFESIAPVKLKNR